MHIFNSRAQNKLRKRQKKQRKMVESAAIVMDREESRPAVRISNGGSNSPPRVSPAGPRTEDEMNTSGVAKIPPRGNQGQGK